MQVIVGNNMQEITATTLYKNTNPEVCLSAGTTGCYAAKVRRDFGIRKKMSDFFK